MLSEFRVPSSEGEDDGEVGGWGKKGIGNWELGVRGWGRREFGVGS
uniref:Uncharacterized protein n=1 Tax=Desertifilum tharense IPPAS B-1220 TaxID=1781255 RepID=A0ACD5GQ78_9CYAN